MADVGDLHPAGGQPMKVEPLPEAQGELKRGIELVESGSET
jgi:hypothetical protein